MGAKGSRLRRLRREVQCLEDRARLIEDLWSITTKLEELSLVEDPHCVVRYWMMDAHELFYDLEAFVDRLVHVTGAVAMTDWMISMTKDRVDGVIGRYDAYIVGHVLRRTTQKILPIYRLPVIYEREPRPVVLFGIKGPTKKVRRLLRLKEGDGEEKQLKVVSIYGDEGVGKSTLSQKLWCELEGDFECRAFIRMAKRPDIRMTLTSILSQIRPEGPPEIYRVPNLTEEIRKHLQDKRYLIVIDGIWSLSIWVGLSRAFPDSNRFSRIIITTTTERIALACCSYDREYIFGMKPLSKDLSKSLFISTAFGPGNKCPPQFNDNVDKISRKCGGLPLALICLASVVASLPETEQQMEYFEFLCSNLEINFTAMDILNQVLKLLYNCLPHSLKTCLLYLGMYPMSYAIVKEDLVKQWIAEGFICPLDGKDIEEVASIYFDELLNLNLIQQMDIRDGDKKRVFYRAHPVLHDFITCRSIQDNFITILDYIVSTFEPLVKIRRLALHFGSATFATAPESDKLSHVRSFYFMGLMSCMPSLRGFELVRVIILHFQGDHGEVSEKKDRHGGTQFSLPEISKLFLLRYLQVRCNVTVILPKKVQCLKYLETLEIDAMVSAVPLDLINHPSLKHVHLGRKMKHNHLIKGPDTMNVSAPSTLNVSGISTSLQKLELLTAVGSFLRIPAWVPSLKHICLGRKMKHNCLNMGPDTSKVSGRISSVSLKKLELLPPICSFSRLPSWVSQLQGLCTLEIVVIELGTDNLEFLSDLPSLTTLSLYVRKPTSRSTITFRAGAFTALKYLKLVSAALLLSFQEKAVCNLEKLKIGFNARRGENCRKILGGIHNLLKLQVIVASIGAAEESDRIMAEYMLQDAVSKHPCCPSIKVKSIEPLDIHI